MKANQTDSPLGRLFREKRVLLCVGAGGVGKTTVSAALATAGAMAGRKTVVVTIDPARRLADAMGLANLSNEPKLVEGDWPGELWALMLDTKAMFDELVTRYATDEEQAQRILNNRYYANIVSVLAGSTEFMAVEKLFDLSEDDYDLIIVDTPPSSNSLEFVSRPGRLNQFMTSRLKWVISPPGALKSVSTAIKLFLRQAAKVVGQNVVDDSVAFLQAFEGMEEGFGERAGDVARLLGDKATSFVLVTSPRPEPADEARRLGDELRAADKTVAALVVNRVTPDLQVDEDDVDLRLGGVAKALADHQRRVRYESTVIEALKRDLGAGTVAQVPLATNPVADMAGITAIAADLD